MFGGAGQLGISEVTAPVAGRGPPFTVTLAVFPTVLPFETRLASSRLEPGGGLICTVSYDVVTDVKPTPSAPKVRTI